MAPRRAYHSEGLPYELSRRIFAIRIRADHVARRAWETLRRYIRNLPWVVYAYYDGVITRLDNTDNVVDRIEHTVYP
jgi:hypothetical protein